PYRGSSASFFVYFSLRRPHTATLFPYTTLFRSREQRGRLDEQHPDIGEAGQGVDPHLAHVDAKQHLALAHAEGACSLELAFGHRSEEHTSELQSRENLVCRLLLEKKKKTAHAKS